MKTTIYTLDVDNYAPEIKAITWPYLKAFAQKIGARFQPLTERTHPECECMREKFQIYDQMVVNDDDYAWYIDSDTLIHPDMYDLTCHLPPDTVLNYGKDVLSVRFRPLPVHRKDGRNIGCGNFFSLVPRACREYWHWPDPAELTYEEIVSRISPIRPELAVGIKPRHLADDFCTSYNLAKHGFKFVTMQDIARELNLGLQYVVHSHLWTRPQKVKGLKKILRQWGFRNRFGRPTKYAVR